MTRKGGQDLGLQSRGANIRWFGKWGMLWNELKDSVEKKIKDLPAPGLLIIQLGSNNLGKRDIVVLIEDIQRDILRIKLLLPNTRIVWSEVLMRHYWHEANFGKAVELAPKRLNLAVKNFVLNEGHNVIRHPNIRARKKNLYRFDGTHFSDAGNAIYLNNIQGALEHFLSSDQSHIFPLESPSV